MKQIYIFYPMNFFWEFTLDGQTCGGGDKPELPLPFFPFLVECGKDLGAGFKVS